MQWDLDAERLVNAVAERFGHDAVGEACYRAFTRAHEECGISGDALPAGHWFRELSGADIARTSVVDGADTLQYLKTELQALLDRPVQ